MFIECVIDESNLEEMLKKVDLKIKRNDIKNIISELFEKKIAEKDGYYKLRDAYIPDIIGKEESKYFFWCLFTGFTYKNGEVIEKVFDTSSILFLKKMVSLYYEKCIVAKRFNENPLGYWDLNYTYQQNNQYNNMYITRNDGNKFIMRVDTTDIINMTKTFLKYYSYIIQSNGQIKLTTTDRECLNEIEMYLKGIKDIGDKDDRE